MVGDSGDGGRAQLEAAELLGHLKPDLILHAGDVVYHRGAEKDWEHGSIRASVKRSMR